MSIMNNPTNANHNTNLNSNPMSNPEGNNTNNYVPPRRPRFKGKSNHCRKWGHRREDCRFLKKSIQKC